MKWKVLAKDGKDIVGTLLVNRGLKTKGEIEEFLNPPDPLTYSPTDLLISPAQLKKTVSRIKQAIKNKESIVVYGDYDADGICASAIMWEALRDSGAKALPFIPQREKEGYGLSIDGIETIVHDTKYEIQNTGGLIITVDSGVVAHEAVAYAKKKGLDVIVVDHHEKPKKLPKAFAIIHTEKLCAGGLAYFVAKELGAKPDLELATIATVTDLMPLTGINRSIVKSGIDLLNKTHRPGLRALFDIAGLEKIGTYEIGFMIGPRLNASGRIENALTALRLLCTKRGEQARELANLLNETNRSRQTMLEEQTTHALEAQSVKLKTQNPGEKIIILEHESYHQGVIGLIAGKLVERYYLPAIVISKGEKISKASARSISGFNIIEAIRSSDRLLVNAGGHPMAAGFTIETSQISNFKFQISNYAQKKITADMLEKTLRIDMEIPLDFVNFELYELLTQLSPFGIGNPEPVFASEATVQNIRTVGQENKHLKMVLIPSLPAGRAGKVEGSYPFDAIAFNLGSLATRLNIGNKIKIAYSLALDTYNGNHKLQLKVKDIWTNS